MHRLFHRQEAGELLGERLSRYAGRGDVVVLALPRGGVPIAREIAKILHAPLDLLVVRKLGVPEFEELAMGAVAMGGAEYIDENVVGALNISREAQDEIVRAARIEMERRGLAYRGERPPMDVRGRVGILV